ncbi:MAG: DUF2268 domain-containing putative Zn-dependent protease [Bdellovibrionota bacterium]
MPLEKRSDFDFSIATDFIKNVCEQNKGKFSIQWLNHEKRFWNFYNAIYYSSEITLKERESLAQNHEENGKNKICKNARAFLIAGPAVVQALVPKIRELLGKSPSSKVYFASALQWTDGRGDKFNGKDIYALNIWHETFSRTTGLTVTIAHELIHNAHLELYPQQRQKLNPLMLPLYREGLAVFAVTKLFPEISLGATGIKVNKRKNAVKLERDVAKEFVNDYKQSNFSEKTINKFFQGKKNEGTIPSKMGYYLGLRIFQELEKEYDTNFAIHISPENFEAKAINILTKLGKGQ